jgi:hypothetical protein
MGVWIMANNKDLRAFRTKFLQWLKYTKLAIAAELEHLDNDRLP